MAKKKRKPALPQKVVKPVLVSQKEEIAKEENSNSIKKTRYRKLLYVIFGMLPLAFLFLYFQRPTSHDFSTTFNTYKDVTFKPTQSFQPTVSPLCGCFDSEKDKDGLILMGNDIEYGRTGYKDSTSFLITAPEPSISGSQVGFSFNAQFYSFRKNENYIKRSKPEKLVSENYSNLFLRKKLDNIPFLSIISPKNINIYLLGRYNVISYLYGENSTCSASLVYDSYEHDVSGVQIKDSHNSIEHNIHYKSPRLDLLSDSIAIVWDGPPVLLHEYGRLLSYPEELEKELYEDSHDYTNVLVVKSPFATRIMAAPWSYEHLHTWRSEVMAQFPKSEEFRVVNDLPIMRKDKDGWHPCKPVKYLIPNYIYDSGQVNIVVNKIYSDQHYDSIYNFFSQKEHMYVNFDLKDTGAFMESYSVYLDDNEKVATILHPTYLDNNFYNRNLSAHEVEKEGKEMKTQLKEYIIDSSESIERIKLAGYSYGFRYPPIPKENGIAIFNEVSYLKMNGAKGTINTDGKITNIDNNNIIEYVNLQNCQFDDGKSLIIPFSEKSPDIKIKGQGVIHVDGQQVKKMLIEKWEIQLILALIGVLGVVLSLIPFFMKAKKG